MRYQNIVLNLKCCEDRVLNARPPCWAMRRTWGRLSGGEVATMSRFLSRMMAIVRISNSFKWISLKAGGQQNKGSTSSTWRWLRNNWFHLKNWNLKLQLIPEKLKTIATNQWFRISASSRKRKNQFAESEIFWTNSSWVWKKPVEPIATFGVTNRQKTVRR